MVPRSPRTRSASVTAAAGLPFAMRAAARSVPARAAWRGSCLESRSATSSRAMASVSSNRPAPASAWARASSSLSRASSSVASDTASARYPAALAWAPIATDRAAAASRAAEVWAVNAARSLSSEALCSRSGNGSRRHLQLLAPCLPVVLCRGEMEGQPVAPGQAAVGDLPEDALHEPVLAPLRRQRVVIEGAALPGRRGPR